jgi:hypothetical protein
MLVPDRMIFKRPKDAVPELFVEWLRLKTEGVEECIGATALDRELPEPAAGDLLAVMSAGAYGAVQAGTYNSRALVPEVLVRADEWALVRPRVTAAELIALDRLPAWL